MLLWVYGGQKSHHGESIDVKMLAKCKYGGNIRVLSECTNRN